MNPNLLVAILALPILFGFGIAYAQSEGLEGLRSSAEEAECRELDMDGWNTTSFADQMKKLECDKLDMFKGLDIGQSESEGEGGLLP